MTHRHTDKIRSAMVRIVPSNPHTNERVLRLSANARLIRNPCGTIRLRLHYTDVAMMNGDGDVSVQHGGWVTPTTRTWIASAIEAFTSRPCGASIAKGDFTVWFGAFDKSKQTEIGKEWTPLEVMS